MFFMCSEYINNKIKKKRGSSYYGAITELSLKI